MEGPALTFSLNAVFTCHLIKLEDEGSYRLPLPHIVTPKNTAAEHIQTGQWCGAYLGGDTRWTIRITSSCRGWNWRTCWCGGIPEETYLNADL